MGHTLCALWIHGNVTDPRGVMGPRGESLLTGTDSRTGRSAELSLHMAGLHLFRHCADERSIKSGMDIVRGDGGRVCTPHRQKERPYTNRIKSVTQRGTIKTQTVRAHEPE